MRIAGALMIIIDSKDKILICKDHDGNGWKFPIGRVVQKEGTLLTVINTIRRNFNLEIKDENIYNSRVIYKIDKGDDIDLGYEIFFIKLKARQKIDETIVKTMEYHWTDKANLIAFIENKKLKVMLKDLYPLLDNYLKKQSKS